MSRIVDIWLSGGVVMIPLFVLAVLIYAQAFQLVMYMRRTQIDASGEMHWREWVRDPSKADGRVYEILRYTQEGASTAQSIRNRFDEVRLTLVSLIDRRTQFVSTLVTAAPLMGLLGTVSGMVKAFNEIASSGGQASPAELADGISQALLTTMFGLIVAIPVTASFAFIRNRMVKTIIEVGAIVEDLFERFRPDA